MQKCDICYFEGRVHNDEKVMKKLQSHLINILSYSLVSVTVIKPVKRVTMTGQNKLTLRFCHVD